MPLSTVSQQRYHGFRFRADKAAEAIHIIASAQPGLTQYFVGKLLYFADKEHFLDWGRPITFDRYVAMEHGPVPSGVRNMMATAAGSTAGMRIDQVEASRSHASILEAMVRVDLELQEAGELQHVYRAGDRPKISSLSKTDEECLDQIISKMGRFSFGVLRRISHEDEAWSEGWGRANGRVAQMDLSLWAEPSERESFREQMQSYHPTV